MPATLRLPALPALALALALTLGAVAPAPVQAQTQLPRSALVTVVHVTDGDTLWVQAAAGGERLQVRVQGIDAPEICQPWGEQARLALVQQLLHQPVVLDTRGRDDYGRLLARVHWSGQDVGAWLVFNGLAWSARWQRRAGPYDALQDMARDAGRGLWSQGRAESPRSFRRRHGPCPHGDSR